MSKHQLDWEIRDRCRGELRVKIMALPVWKSVGYHVYRPLYAQLFTEISDNVATLARRMARG